MRSSPRYRDGWSLFGTSQSFCTNAIDLNADCPILVRPVGIYSHIRCNIRDNHPSITRWSSLGASDACKPKSSRHFSFHIPTSVGFSLLIRNSLGTD